MASKTLNIREPSNTSLPARRRMSKEWYTQKRPYKAPLPYYVTSQWSDKYRDADTVSPASLYPIPAATQNALYGKIMSRLKYDRSDLLVTMAEYKQSRDMIAKRSLQLLGFVNSLRKGEFLKAGRQLGLDVGYDGKKHKVKMKFKERHFRRDSKSVANNFLEYHFGWKPLIGDIVTSAKVLTNGIPSHKIKASASASISSITAYSDGMYVKTRIERSSDWRITHGATVSVHNSDLWLANQLGLLNPAAIAWEIVPYSFVVDWFGNIGDVLASFTDTAGLTLTNEYTSTKSSYTETTTYTAIPGPWYNPGNNNIRSHGSKSFRRSLGSLPRPTLLFELNGLSPEQGASAIALLVQKLPPRNTLLR